MLISVITLPSSSDVLLILFWSGVSEYKSCSKAGPNFRQSYDSLLTNYIS